MHRGWIPWLAAVVAALVCIFLVTIFDDRTFHRLVASMAAFGVGFVIYCITDMAMPK